MSSMQEVDEKLTLQKALFASPFFPCRLTVTFTIPEAIANNLRLASPYGVRDLSLRDDDEALRYHRIVFGMGQKVLVVGLQVRVTMWKQIGGSSVGAVGCCSDRGDSLVV